jgi:hypothetical protein
VATNDARYLASLTNLTAAAIAAAGGVTGITYYAGTTAYTSNGVAYVGTNSFGGGSSGGGNLSATNTPTAGQMLYAGDTTMTNLYFGAAPAGGGASSGNWTNYILNASNFVYTACANLNEMYFITVSNNVQTTNTLSLR